MPVVAKPGDLIVLVLEDGIEPTDEQRASIPDGVSVLAVSGKVHVQRYTFEPGALIVLTWDRAPRGQVSAVSSGVKEYLGERVGVLVRQKGAPEIDRFTAEEMERAGWVRRQLDADNPPGMATINKGHLPSGGVVDPAAVAACIDADAALPDVLPRTQDQIEPVPADGDDAVSAPSWYPLLCAVEPQWRTPGDAGHTAALAFLASVYDGDEPKRWLVCVDDQCVLRVDWQGETTAGPVRDAAVVPPLAEIPELTVWGDSPDVPLYEWTP